MGEESEDERTSIFSVGDFQITAKDDGSCEGGETYFGSDPKEGYKSELQSPLEPHNDEEDKATPFGCEPENLVEDQATIVPLHKGEEDEMPRYDVLYDFCKDHISFQPSEIPSTSYHGSDFATYSKVGRYVENEICVVDQCHKQDDIMFQPWEGETLVVILFLVDH